MTGGRVEENITEVGTGGGPGKERGQGSAPFSSALFMLGVQELIWGDSLDAVGSRRRGGGGGRGLTEVTRQH